MLAYEVYTVLLAIHSTKLDGSMLTPFILARVGRRAYNTVDFKRSADIWLNRDDLLAYERAIHIEADIDWILNPDSRVNTFSGRFTNTTRSTRKKKKGKKALASDEEEGSESIGKTRARQVLEIFELVYPEWKALLKAVDGQEPRPQSLSRFESGTGHFKKYLSYGFNFSKAMSSPESSTREQML
jgi:hypothetical protein